MSTSLQILLFIALLMNLRQQWEFLCKLLVEPAAVDRLTTETLGKGQNWNLLVQGQTQ